MSTVPETATASSRPSSTFDTRHLTSSPELYRKRQQRQRLFRSNSLCSLKDIPSRSPSLSYLKRLSSPYPLPILRDHRGHHHKQQHQHSMYPAFGLKKKPQAPISLLRGPSKPRVQFIQPVARRPPQSTSVPLASGGGFGGGAGAPTANQNGGGGSGGGRLSDHATRILESITKGQLPFMDDPKAPTANSIWSVPPNHRTTEQDADWYRKKIAFLQSQLDQTTFQLNKQQIESKRATECHQTEVTSYDQAIRELNGYYEDSVASLEQLHVENQRLSSEVALKQGQIESLQQQYVEEMVRLESKAQTERIADSRTMKNYMNRACELEQQVKMLQDERDAAKQEVGVYVEKLDQTIEGMEKENGRLKAEHDAALEEIRELNEECARLQMMINEMTVGSAGDGAGDIDGSRDPNNGQTNPEASTANLLRQTLESKQHEADDLKRQVLMGQKRSLELIHSLDRMKNVFRDTCRGLTGVQIDTIEHGNRVMVTLAGDGDAQQNRQMIFRRTDDDGNKFMLVEEEMAKSVVDSLRDAIDTYLPVRGKPDEYRTDVFFASLTLDLYHTKNCDSQIRAKPQQDK